MRLGKVYFDETERQATPLMLQKNTVAELATKENAPTAPKPRTDPASFTPAASPAFITAPPPRARTELKYFISYAEAAALRNRLLCVMHPDKHADEFRHYTVTSLYFDTPDNRSQLGSEAGARCRKKYRIRVYNHSPSFIALECKQKCGNRGWKDVVSLSGEEYRSLLAGDPSPLAARREPAAQQAYIDMRTLLYRPAAVVEYEREVFLHPIEDIRITYDTHIRGCDRPGDILSPPPLSHLIPPDRVLLEVKYHRFLPAFIHDLLPTEVMASTPNCKYTHARALEL